MFIDSELIRSVNMSDFLTVKEVASKLRMHPGTIRRYVLEGKIKAKKIGKAWLVSQSNVENFVNK